MNDHTDYIITNYSGVLTSAEAKAVKTLQVLEKKKVDYSEDPEPRLDGLRERGWLYDQDPEVRDLMADGEEAFHARLVERVRAEHAEEVFFNYCAECRGLTATPLARQCLHCGHDWH